jgi:hypothetical protein
MKKLALITSFCDTEEKIDILVNNIKKLKQLEVDVMLSSPILHMKRSIIDLCDFYFLTKENPILRWPERAHNFWIRIENKHKQQIYLHRFLDDYGWAALYQTKKLAQIGITYDYDIFYHMIYDLNIDDDIINDIKGNVVNRTYHRFEPGDNSAQWNVNLHFLPLDKNITKFLSENIKKEEYISSSSIAEDLIEKILKPLDLEKSKFAVSDLIRYDYSNQNLHNYSKNNNYKIFFSRKEDEYKFIIYDIKIDIEKIEVNGLDVEFEDTVPVILKETNLDSFIVYTSDSKDNYTNEFNYSLNSIDI